MRLHRFAVSLDLKTPELVITDSKVINQIRNVLRLTSGDKFLLFSNNEEVEAEITDMRSNELQVRLSNLKEIAQPGREVTLYSSILKKENFELVVQKATECGVVKVAPIISQRTVKTGLNVERLKKIAEEAAEQCGRASIPLIEPTVSFSEAIETAKENNLEVYLFDSGGESFSPKLGPIGIFCGPEGGWTDDEIDLAKKYGAHVVSLGPLTLRGETAAIISSYLAVNDR